MRFYTGSSVMQDKLYSIRNINKLLPYFCIYAYYKTTYVY